MEVVRIKKILAQNLLIFIGLHFVNRSSWSATKLATLLKMAILDKIGVYPNLWGAISSVIMIQSSIALPPEGFFSSKVSIYLITLWRHQNFLTNSDQFVRRFLDQFYAFANSFFVPKGPRVQYYVSKVQVGILKS